MIDTTILIDQSYFLQDNENIKTPEEKAQDFMQEFVKASRDSQLLDSLSEKDRDEALSGFLFMSLGDYTADSSDLPTRLKLDKYILNNILSSPEEETEVEVETESPQGSEESEGGEEDSEDSESYENSENPVNPENSVNLEGLSSGNEGIERLTVENPKEIQDGESITIRRDPSAPTNRFF